MPQLLNDTNKLRIPFVQGKFNMGGTGVFLFCGDRSMQVMITRRHPEIAIHEKNDNSRNDWCFTVVRREDPREGQKSSIFTYLSPNGKIPRFKAGSLPLFPQKYPEPNGAEIEHGTFIKIIEYQIPRYKTLITLDMYNRLNCLLPRLALPIRLWDRRKGWSAQSFETTLSGLSVRLEEDTRGMLEFKSSSTFDIDGKTFPTRIYAFKKEEQAKRYRNEEGVIFVKNGQTHGHLKKDFFRRKNVGMLNLANLLLVEVNCDALDRRSDEKLFMASRDRLRNGQLKKDVENQLQILISEHAGLRELKERRRREEVKERLETCTPLENVLEKIIKSNPTLASLLSSGVRISHPFKRDEASSTDEFVGKKYPTYFELKASKKKDFVKNCYIKQRFRIQFATDAEDNYFNRDTDPGTLHVYCNDEKYPSGVVNLWRGTATLNLELPDNAQRGDEYEFLVSVTDASRVQPFLNPFKAYVAGIAKKNGKPSKGKRKRPVKPGDGTEQRPNGLGIPEVYEVNEDGWDRYGFDRESGIALRQGEGGYYFMCNVDNVYLKNEQKTSNTDAELLKLQFKYGLALVSLALLNEEEKRDKKNDIKDNGDGESIAQIVFEVTKAISPFVLPIIRELGGISI